MSIENDENGTLPTHVSDYLRQVDGQWRTHEELGREALHVRGDAAAYNEHIEAQAELLIGMPGRLAGLEEAGVAVPSEVSARIIAFAGEATASLEALRDGSGTHFLIGSIITHPGGLNADPTDLALLADRYEPVVDDPTMAP